MSPARVIALALLMGQVLFAGVIVFLHQSGSFRDGVDGQVGEPLRVVALALGFGVVPVALVLHHKAQQRIDTLPEDQKAAARLSAMVVSLALLEAGALFNLVVWLLTAVAMPNVAVVGLLVAVQLYLFPRS